MHLPTFVMFTNPVFETSRNAENDDIRNVAFTWHISLQLVLSVFFVYK